MFSTAISPDSNASKKLETEQIDDSINPWYFYFHADKAKAKGRVNNQYEFIINRKNLEHVLQSKNCSILSNHFRLNRSNDSIIIKPKPTSKFFVFGNVLFNNVII